MNDAWAAREKIKVVADAKSYLVDFVQTFALMPFELRPAAVKCAVEHLVVLALADPVRTELFTRDVARAADVPRTTLRKQIEERVWFFRNFNRLMENKRTREQTENEVVRMICL